MGTEEVTKARRRPWGPLGRRARDLRRALGLALQTVGAGALALLLLDGGSTRDRVAGVARWGPGRARPGASLACGRRQRIAVLIAGQLARFTWREEAGALVEPADPACPPVVDVYIALQTGAAIHSPTSSWGQDSTGAGFGPQVHVPYADETSAADLKAWYRRRGARQVRVEWVAPEGVEGFQGRLYAACSPEERAHVDVQTRLLDRRLVGTVNQLYVKHRAFAQAVESGEAYDGYTAWREDNFFFEPLPQGAFPPPSAAGADVVVDRHCGWQFFSDKIYVTNRAGAALLFSEAEAALVEKLRGYVRYALTHPDPQWRRQSWDGQGWQIERWLEHLLQPATVSQRDLRRADVRYTQGVFCVTRAYVFCSPGVVDSGLYVCPGRAMQAGGFDLDVARKAGLDYALFPDVRAHFTPDQFFKWASPRNRTAGRDGATEMVRWAATLRAQRLQAGAAGGGGDGGGGGLRAGGEELKTS